MISTASKIRFIWKAHIANWLWKDRDARRVTREEAYSEMKMGYLRKYIPFARALKAEGKAERPADYGQEKIFTLWLQGVEEAPEIVKCCIASMKRHFGDRVTVLTEENLYDFIQLPPEVIEKWKRKDICAANFSDIVRIELLHRYGGYWFDATDYVTGDIFESVKETDFFMYVPGDRMFTHMFVQTCFMRVVKNDPLLTMWRELLLEYWKKENKAVDFFLAHMMLRLLVTHNDEARRLYDRMPKEDMYRTHVMWFRLGNEPFDRKECEAICKRAFFQKCSYKGHNPVDDGVVPGSFASYMLKGEI